MSTTSATFSARRVGAMVRRYTYVLTGSGPRTLELVYWPTMQIILWGFVSHFLTTNSS